MGAPLESEAFRGGDIAQASVKLQCQAACIVDELEVVVHSLGVIDVRADGVLEVYDVCAVPICVSRDPSESSPRRTTTA